MFSFNLMCKRQYNKLKNPNSGALLSFVARQVASECTLVTFHHREEDSEGVRQTSSSLTALQQSGNTGGLVCTCSPLRPGGGSGLCIADSCQFGWWRRSKLRSLSCSAPGHEALTQPGGYSTTCLKLLPETKYDFRFCVLQHLLCCNPLKKIFNLEQARTQS